MGKNTVALALLLFFSSVSTAANATELGKKFSSSDLEQVLRKQWKAEGHLFGKNPFVSFTVNKDGSITELKLEKSSEDAGLDQDALQLIKKLAPFTPPPEKPAKIGTIFGDIDFGPFMTSLQKQIKRAWFPPKGQETKRLLVAFKLAPNGEVSNIHIQDSSGVMEVDEAGIKAIAAAQPFEHLPDGVVEPVDVAFTFDYNIFKHGRLIGSTSAPVVVSVTLTNASDSVRDVYLNSVASLIQAKAMPIRDLAKARLKALLTISSNGLANGVDITESSGSKDLDSACMKAIVDASPFQPLPPGAPDKLQVQCSFEPNREYKPATPPQPLPDTTNKHAPVDKPTPEKAPPSGTDSTQPQTGSTATDHSTSATAVDSSARARAQKDNNEGVTFTRQHEFTKAIAKLLEAITEDPGYTIAKNNLAIVYNNLALEHRSEPEKGLQAVCRALYIDPENVTTVANFNGFLELCGKRPHSYSGYVELGDKALNDHRMIDAYVMYKEALKIKNDPELETKTEHLHREADSQLISSPLLPMADAAQ